jgi:hypothetical protein
VRTKSEARNRLGTRVTASGRSAHDPSVLMSSGSALAAALGLGKVMSSSRKALWRFASSSTTCPGSLRWSLSCAQTSALISSAVHLEATFPVRREGRSQSETSTERIPPTCPSPSSAKSVRGQNWRWEIEVSAQSESL